MSPIAKMTTVRAMLAVTALKNWHVHQLDISNAFLNGELEEVVYMIFPKRYTGYGSRIAMNGKQDEAGNNVQLVCQLKKALYGLLQASRRWHHKLSATLVSMGFRHCKANYNLYSRVSNVSCCWHLYMSMTY